MRRPVIVLALLLSAALALAQPTPLLIYLEINAPITSADSSFEPGQSNFAAEFVPLLAEKLEATGVEYAFIGYDAEVTAFPDLVEPTTNYIDPFAPDATTLSVSVRPFGDTDAVYIAPFAAYDFPPLPAGTHGWSATSVIRPDAPEALQATVSLTAGIALYVARDCEQALPLLETAAADDALVEGGLAIFGTSTFYRAACEYVSGDTDAAIAAYRAILETPEDESTPEVEPLFDDYSALNLAWIYAHQGEKEAALDLLNRFADVERAVWSAREMERFFWRADVYLTIGDDAAAIDELTRLIAITTAPTTAEGQPNTGFGLDEIARAYTERGLRYARIGDMDAALEDYDLAIRTDPNYPKAYYWRGLLHLEMEDEAAALADFQQFVAAAPGYFNYYEQDLTPLLEDAEAQIAALS